MTEAQTATLPPGPLPNGHDPSGHAPGIQGWPCGGDRDDPATGAGRARRGRRPGAMAALALDGKALAELRRLVEETPLPLRQIALDLGVPSGSLHRFVVEQDWARPPDAPRAAMRRETAAPQPARPPLATSLDEAGAVTGRLIGAVERQVAMIEARLTREGAEVEEKDARILGNLAKTLATLMALERDGGAKPDRAEPSDRGEFRAELARKIAAWAAEEEEPAGSVGEAERG